MNISKIVVFMSVVLLSAGCLTSGIRPARETVISLPTLPDRPSDFTPEERAAVGKIAAVGVKLALEIDECGASPKSEQSQSSLSLWRVLETWTGTMQEAGEITAEAVEKCIENLRVATEKARKEREAFWSVYNRMKAEIEEIKAKNLLVARDLSQLNQELLLRREKMQDLENENADLRARDRKFLFWGINLFGLLGAGAAVLCFLKFGLKGGIAACVLAGSLYLGGMAAYIYKTHPEFVKLSLGLGLGILVVGYVLYAYWGAIMEKLFRKQVSVHQNVRREMSEEARKEMDEKFREKNDLVRTWMIDNVKKSDHIDHVT